MEAISLNRQQVDLESLNTALARTQRLAGLGTLTAGVAHELTNPISVITATCNTLLSQVADDNLSTDQLLSYVQMIDYSAWRCARILQTLSSYSHDDASELVPADLNHIIDDCLGMASFRPGHQERIEVKTKLDRTIPPVNCDPNQIAQVFINLLANAGDALGERGGTILVLSWFVPIENAVAFSINDSGPGIAPEILDRIFDPFFTTKALGEGTGLGLSIAHGIVQQHHGRITATNNPDRGATLTVVIPCRPPE